MKLLFRSYLSSLREREELDAILPDLLSELGFNVYSRPQRGTAQAGVDIAAVGKDDDGERKVFLFSVKQGDLTRSTWDGSPQALRPSLNEILDTYIPTRIPKRYQKLKIVICLVFGGDMQEQVRGHVTGFIRRNSSRRISFDEWNGDRLAALLLKGVLREEIMPKTLRADFQKAVAMLDQPDVAYRHFAQMTDELCRAASSDSARIRAARQMYIGLWVLFVWARDSDNVEAPYRISELILLKIWYLLTPYIGKGPKSTNKAITQVLVHAIQLHITISTTLLDKKVLPHVGKRDAIATAVLTRSHVDVNLKLFDILGRLALTGLWLLWLIEQSPEQAQRELAIQRVAKLSAVGFQLINNNPALFLPLQDQQAIEVALFLILVGMSGGNHKDAHSWLHEMVQRLTLAVQTHGRYPCVFTEYRALVVHPRERTDIYRKEATSGSILIPLVAAFMSAFGDAVALEKLTKLVDAELEHCTIQLWIPDSSSDEGFCKGSHDHGVALCDLPITKTGHELVKAVKDACLASKDFEALSAMRTSYWPIILTAARHYRLPVPPQFWINMVS